MSARWQRLLVVGLGLLGGSVARAARERGVAKRVVGLSRRREVAAEALATGAVDEAHVEARAAAAGADLVVLCTPVAAMGDSLRAVAPHLARGALVTDVGSVTGPVVDTLPGLLPPGARFVGSHPMAGGHHTGLRHARADLFAGAACVVTPVASTPREDVERIAGFWRALGAGVVLRDAAAHDAEVAWVSHAPHALAFAFAHALAAAPAAAGELAGAGFRDFTRIAGSDPEMWGEILVANRKSLSGPLAHAAGRLAELAALVEAGDAEAVHRFLATARDSLAAVAAKARSGGPYPEIKAAPEAATKE
jgi:prephenate dehydrogenase